MDFIMLQLKDLFVALFTGPESGEFIYPSLCSQWMLCIKAKDLCKVKFKRYLPWHETNVFFLLCKNGHSCEAWVGGLDHFNLSFLSVNAPILPLPQLEGRKIAGKRLKMWSF